MYIYMYLNYGYFNTFVILLHDLHYVYIHKTIYSHPAIYIK